MEFKQGDFFQPYCNFVWTQNLKIQFRYVFHEEWIQFWLKKKPEIPRETEMNAKHKHDDTKGLKFTIHFK